jgi:peptide/nickel transport system permease protein
MMLSYRYALGRIAQAIGVVVLVSMIVFGVIRLLPGDPVMILSGTGTQSLTPEQEDKLRHELGLDRAIPVQYATWVGGLLQGDWGTSTTTGAPVWEDLTNRAPTTIQLALFAWVLSVSLGLLAGVTSAVHRGKALDTVASLIAMFGIAMPDFWLAILLIYFFALQLGWLPAVGYVSPFSDPWQAFVHLLMPALALGLHEAAVIMRQTRSGMLEVLFQDYIRVARAKGTPQRVVIWVHALRNAALPIVTIMGLRFGRLIGGTVVIESIFGLPGLGRLAVQSIVMRDYLALQGVVLLTASAIVVINLITDLLYAWLDPRIRLGARAA